MRSAGLIYDDSRHYIDHLAPFCALLGWPLIVCEEAVADLSRRYYPDLQVIQKPALQLQLPPQIVACDTRPLLRAAFPNQTFQSLWLPHGNSDKGTKSSYFEALREEEYALVYGQKMIDFMREKQVAPKTIRIGNFRWQYYLKHQSFYQKFALPKGKQTFLYAPTWDDYEGSSSFWTAFPHLANSLPKDCYILVKLHPNTLRKFEVELEILMGRYAERKNIHFLPEFPPIYPLLNLCDAYIGDRSSIGYDFLKFDRPLFFLNADPDLYLSRCGTPIKPDQFNFRLQDHLSSIRKEAYEYTFDPNPQWEELHALCSL